VLKLWRLIFIMLDQQLVELLLWLVKNEEFSSKIFIFHLQIVLILDIIAAIEILRSGKTVVEKVLWILFIIFFPIIGKNKCYILLIHIFLIFYRFDCLFTLWSFTSSTSLRYSTFCTINCSHICLLILFNRACVST
jgi:hypothetical protein